MTEGDYLDLLAERYSAYYDVERRVDVNGRTAEILATSRVRFERHFLSRSMPLYGYDTYTRTVVAYATGHVDAPEAGLFCDYLEGLIPVLVHPSLETMSTLLNGVLVCGAGVSEEAVQRVKAFRRVKSFCLGLRGWCRVGLVVVDFPGRRVYTNVAARGYESAHRCAGWEVREG